jgi:hypothetical protein
MYQTIKIMLQHFPIGFGLVTKNLNVYIGFYNMSWLMWDPFWVPHNSCDVKNYNFSFSTTWLCTLK